MMKIIHCPKGGRVPEGYCMRSCLNYNKEHSKVQARRGTAFRRMKDAFAGPWRFVPQRHQKVGHFEIAF